MFETEIAFTLLIFSLAILTAIFGVLTGLGGGILIVPILSFFQIDIRHAMGVSLLSIVALSLSTATTKTSHLLTNVKVGVFLETAAVIGAFFGAIFLPFMPVKLIAIIFGIVLIFIASSKNHKTIDTTVNQQKHDLNKSLGLYPKLDLFYGWVAMVVSGILSGILGIGSGALKVLAMDRIIGLPYKVSTATSNFMVGMTATASIGIYFFNNYIRYELMFPVIVGVYLGTFIGTKLLVISKIHILRLLFQLVMYVLAVQMLYKGWVS